MKNKNDTFLWGAATSSHQVEGDNSLNDWWEWESLGKVRTRSGKACDHYNRFKEDFCIVRELGHNAHRFSLEWSRLEPEEGRWDMAAWGHYKEALLTLRSFNIEPILTINHFTLPLWFYRKGGWTCSDSISHFENFAKKAVEMLGNDVVYWITLNEPLVHAFLAYYKGTWPPGRTRIRDAFLVIENQLRAHMSAYRAMHETSNALFGKDIKIGVAHNVTKFFPCSNLSIKDNLAAFMRHHMYNHLFVWSAINGCIVFPGFRPQILPGRNTLDFIGLNYYTAEHIRYGGPVSLGLVGEPCYLPHHRVRLDWGNMLGWRVYPKGMYLLLKDFARYRLPIIITENGIPTNDDAERIRFTEEHLDWVFRAKEEGVPVAGYLYWSLLDNFEWADGYAPRFGLVEVDYGNYKRTVRPSAKHMSDYIKSRI